MHQVPSVHIRQEYWLANRPSTSRVHLEEADREGIAPTATYDATVAALHLQRDVRAGETYACGGHDVTRIHSRGGELWSTRRHGSARTHPGRKPTATADKLEEFRRVIVDDPAMQCLRRFIQHGWPKLKSAIPPEIQSY